VRRARYVYKTTTRKKEERASSSSSVSSDEEEEEEEIERSALARFVSLLRASPSLFDENISQSQKKSGFERKKSDSSSSRVPFTYILYIRSARTFQRQREE